MLAPPRAAGEPPVRRVATRATLTVAIIVVAFGVFWASPVRLETDSFWVVFTARSLVAHQDADLDEYASIIHRGTGFQVESSDGDYYYSAPVGTALAAVPFVAVASAIDGHGLDRRLASGRAQPLDGIIAAALAALTTGLLFLVMLRLSRHAWVALTTTGVFALGTQVWSTASRTLWMHGPSMLCLTLALLVALRVRRSGAWCAPLGAILCTAYFVRPTNVVPLVFFGIWVVSCGRRPAIRFAIGAASVAVGFGLLDLALFGKVVQPYFRASRIGLSPTTVEALLGNLVSPARGLFVYVPVSLLCGYGFLLERRTRTLTSLDVTIAASIVGYWLLVSTFPSWWGGWAYGPRFLTDVAPMLVWFLPPVLEAVVEKRRVGLGMLVTLLIMVSIFVQARGALAPSTAEWNWRPSDIGLDHPRLWDWSDPQFLR